MAAKKLGRGRGADHIDKQVGENVRRLRLQAGLSQTKLAELGGVTFQQQQKYEHGTNRMSPSRLLRYSHALGLEGRIDPFFEGCALAGDDVKKLKQPTAAINGKAIGSHEMLNLTRGYMQLDQTTRGAVRSFISSLQER